MGTIEKKIKYARLEGWFSIVINIILSIVKYWAGLVSGSVALIADAWHTLSDSLSSVIILIGAKLSTKPPDEKHPFGHGRFEFISTFLVAIMLFLVAFSFARESIEKFANQQDAKYGTIAIIVTIVSIIGKEILAQYAFYCGRQSDSDALKADGWHHRSDAISSVVILAGIIVGKNYWWMDSLLGMIVAILIGYTALNIILKTISRIIGEIPDKKIIARIIEISDFVCGPDVMPHHFHLHDYVTHKELTFHLKLDPEMNIKKAHTLVSEIEMMIKEELDIEATIHIEPKQISENE
jgi:cation diffusion facilitator family transporter